MVSNPPPADSLFPPAPDAKGLRRIRGRVLFAVVAPFQAFFRLEAASGLLLMICAALALIWANSPFRDLYDAIFHAPIEMKIAGVGIDWTVHHFTNDALMTLFFIVAGLEIKREIVQGELRSWGRAALPLIAAAGGMLVPALIYFGFNPSGPERAGWGIPMATDIAFALGCLSLVRRRVPTSVFVFLTALAIFDDLGAIVVIALFYGGNVSMEMLAVSLLLAAVMIVLGRMRVQPLWPYVLVGTLLWVAVLGSGIHATLAGVVIGLALPTVPGRPPRDVLDDLDVAITSLRRECDRRGVAPEGAVAAIERHVEAVQSPLSRMTHSLHGVVAYGVVPLFALANAGVTLGTSSALASSVTLGVFFGLCLGKPIGVLGSTWLATRLGLAPRPTGATWAQLFAASVMAGIGFTMSLLVGNLGFSSARALEDQAKLGVLTASLVSALLGLFILRRFSQPSAAVQDSDMPVVLDVPRFARGYGVRPCSVGGFLLGRTIAELDVRRRYGVTVIGGWLASGGATSRNLEPVEPDRPLRDGDILLVAGAERAVDDFLAQVTASGEPDAKIG